MNIQNLLDYTAQFLQVERFKDYCPNGLQVQGKLEINKIVTGVTASMALLEAAKHVNADAILVHHGYFWRNEDARVIGIKQRRLKYLLENELNLIAYHLPLDAHTELGNNACLAKVLNFNVEKWAGDPAIIACGAIEAPMSLADFGVHIASKLNRQPLILGNPKKIIQRVAWCTGAAQNYFEEAIALGVDAYISGEVSEQTYHLAEESGVAYLACGHHATERYGIQALGKHLAQIFALEHVFIDIDNPV